MTDNCTKQATVSIMMTLWDLTLPDAKKFVQQTCHQKRQKQQTVSVMHYYCYSPFMLNWPKHQTFHTLGQLMVPKCLFTKKYRTTEVERDC